ncbi:MAG TPA: hypothetical protein ENK06_10210, partial [Gammaproteobacteria bacterium]|nr:hypothetical protein [Gammaproteobacteria bacterium]
MLKRATYAILLLFVTNSSQADQLITLEDVVRSVLNSHLEIEKQRTYTERSDAAAQQTRSEFDWSLFAEGGYKRPRVPGSNDNGLLTAETKTNNVYNITVGMEKRFRNGITVAPGVSYSQNTSKNSSDVLANSVSLGHLAVTIPLLKGRGTEATTANERVAQETYEATRLDSDRAIAILLVNAASQYWQTVAATRNLAAARRAGKEAAAITETLKTLSEQGELSVLEYQNSVASLNLRRLKIEKSAVTWNSTRRKLARIIQNGYRINKLPISGEQFPAFDVEAVLGLNENTL